MHVAWTNGPSGGATDWPPGQVIRYVHSLIMYNSGMTSAAPLKCSPCNRVHALIITQAVSCIMYVHTEEVAALLAYEL